MKKPEEVMEILEAYDLTGSFRAAAGLVGCDHKTVAYWVRQRDEAGGMPVVERARPAMEAVFAGEDRRAGRPLARSDPGGCRAWEAGRDRLSGVGADDAAVGGGVQAAVASQSTVGGRGRGSRSRGCGCSGTMATGPKVDGRGDGVVLRVAGVVAVPGGGAVARQDAAVGGDRAWTGRCACSVAARRTR